MVKIESIANAEIIFECDKTNETSDRIPAIPIVVYAVENRRLFLSQAVPPISSALFGKRLLLTFLERNEGKNHRYAFWAKLIGLSDYDISPSQRVPVLVVEKETDPETCNLRMSFRIRPDLDRGLAVFLRGAKVNIVDISEGGVCISSKKDLALAQDDRITLTISIDDRKIDVDSRVVRVTSSQAAAGSSVNQQLASFQFLNNQAARETLLSRKIFHLERTQIKNRVR